MRTHADYAFTRLLSDLLTSKSVATRNSNCRRLLAPDPITFHSLPLITVRPVAARKAFLELEWFMSGNSKCPDALLNWWRGQLNFDGRYLDGYPVQLRAYSFRRLIMNDFFDQIAYVIESLRGHPYSRRHVITTWNPGEMAHISEINKNPNTPTTCHLSFVQFFVEDGTLHMHSTQRSADVLLGLPHNWVQHWSLLTWLAHHCGYKVGWMKWQGMDVHLYDEPSHIQCAEEITNSNWWFEVEDILFSIRQFLNFSVKPNLIYTPSTPAGSAQEIADGYRGADFRIVWPDGQNKPEPLSKILPVLK